MTTLLVFTLVLACAAGALWLIVTDLVVGRSQRAALARVAAYGRGAARPADPVMRSRGPDVAGLLARALVAVVPGRDRESTTTQLQAAGFNARHVDRFLAAKAGLTLALALLGLVVGARSSAVALVALPLAGGGLGFVVPDMLLTRRAQQRKDDLLGELPNALDLIAVVVEAGLGLDAALARYADRADGPLADELSVLGAELRVGSSRAAAFRAFAERNPSPETQSFARAVTTADQLGTSLSRTLRIQAQDSRVRRQMRAEQLANKMPVKILFPTVFCIFPALFIVVLAPAVLKLLHG